MVSPGCPVVGSLPREPGTRSVHGIGSSATRSCRDELRTRSPMAAPWRSTSCAHARPVLPVLPFLRKPEA